MEIPFIIIAAIILSPFIFWVLRQTTHLRHPLTVEPHHLTAHYHKSQLVELLQPGIYRFWGNKHTFQHFDTRTQQLAIQTQELTSAEGITIKATVVGFYKIIDPLKILNNSDNYQADLYTKIQLALRDLVTGSEAESLLASTSLLGSALLEQLSEPAQNLGIEFSELTIRDLILPSEIKQALSEAWRAKKHSMAELESARGKAAAARTLANAAKLYDTNPSLLQVRYLEALETAASGVGNTFVLGLPDEKALSLTK